MSFLSPTPRPPPPKGAGRHGDRLRRTPFFRRPPAGRPPYHTPATRAWKITSVALPPPCASECSAFAGIHNNRFTKPQLPPSYPNRLCQPTPTNNPATIDPHIHTHYRVSQANQPTNAIKLIDQQLQPNQQH